MGRRMATRCSRPAALGDREPAGLTAEQFPSQTVTVPAGTFTVTRHRVLDASGRSWSRPRSATRPCAGVVRSETDKVKMELVATGKDAVSLITETPVMMKTPPGMPEGNPRACRRAWRCRRPRRLRRAAATASSP